MIFYVLALDMRYTAQLVKPGKGGLDEKQKLSVECIWNRSRDCSSFL